MEVTLEVKVFMGPLVVLDKYSIGGMDSVSCLVYSVSPFFYSLKFAGTVGLFLLSTRGQR